MTVHPAVDRWWCGNICPVANVEGKPAPDDKIVDQFVEQKCLASKKIADAVEIYNEVRP
jgi:hypothetical protein